MPVRRPGPAQGCAIVGCAIVALFFVLFLTGVIGAIFSGTSTTTTPGIRKTPAPSHGVVNLHGSASTTTHAFEMGREWDLVWSYNCANLGRNGTFAVVTHLIGAPSEFDDRIDRIGRSDSGRMHSRRGGTYTATVTTSCHWSIKTIDHV
jgi:hypothetical protein